MMVTNITINNSLVKTMIDADPRPGEEKPRSEQARKTEHLSNGRCRGKTQVVRHHLWQQEHSMDISMTKKAQTFPQYLNWFAGIESVTNLNPFSEVVLGARRALLAAASFPL